jgi:hypothetical protein
MQTATISRTAPLALWRIAEAFLNILHSLFGAPEDVAREHTLTRAAHTLLHSWLRVGEALLRRLLGHRSRQSIPHFTPLPPSKIKHRDRIYPTPRKLSDTAPSLTHGGSCASRTP